MKDHEWDVYSSDAQEKTSEPLFPQSDNAWPEEKPVAPCQEPNTKKALPEVSNAWGDFEGFSELTPRSEQFYYEDEATLINAFPTTTSNDERGTGPTPEHDEREHWEAFTGDNEEAENCESILKQSFPAPPLSFPALPLEETNETARNLDAQLTSCDEDNAGCRLIKSGLWHHCDESGKEGRLNERRRVDWATSKACGDLLALLGVSAENTRHQKEEMSDWETAPPAGNPSLIQTKEEAVGGSSSCNVCSSIRSTTLAQLEVAPRQGHIFSYLLFLKQPVEGAPLHLANHSGRKSFFRANQMPFYF